MADCPQCGAQNYTQENDTADHASTCSMIYNQQREQADAPADAPTEAAPEAPAEEPAPEPPADPES